MAFNSDYFDLTNWKITLPVDSGGGTGGTAVEVSKLVGYESSKHFYDAADGAMVFKAAVDGATTSGSSYARTELREMNGSAKAAWTLSQGGTMTATLEVDAVPTRSDGTPGKIVVGQIHGEDDELVRLYYEKGSVYFVNDQAGSGNDELKFLLKNAAGQVPSISLNEKFSYKIDARGNKLVVEVHADGQVYSSTTTINSVWQSDTFYFKAGVYLGVNETGGTGHGQASFYGLDFGHTPGSGLGGLATIPDPAPIPEPTPDPIPEPAPTPAPTPTPTPTTPGAGADTVTGTSGKDTIRGHDGDDLLRGASGNDAVYGDSGDDILHGDDGNDSLRGGDGADILHGGAGNDIGHGDLGDDTLFGGAGNDSLRGVDGDDVLHGELGNDRLYGEVGDDWLYGEDGKDTLYGGDGHDILSGGLADDSLKGDDGNDRLSGDDGKDKLSGGDDDDVLDGGAGNDSLAGDSGNDSLLGGAGNDSLLGGNGADVLQGGAGNDRLWGDSGNDILNGGEGVDSLTGGTGSDVFAFDGTAYSGSDIVMDFRKGQDSIDVSDLLGLYDPAAHVITDFVRITTSGSNSYLAVDADGGGDRFVTIAQIRNVTGLTDEAALDASGTLITF